MSEKKNSDEGMAVTGRELVLYQSPPITYTVYSRSGSHHSFSKKLESFKLFVDNFATDSVNLARIPKWDSLVNSTRAVKTSGFVFPPFITTGESHIIEKDDSCELCNSGGHKLTHWDYDVQGKDEDPSASCMSYPEAPIIEDVSENVETELTSPEKGPEPVVDKAPTLDDVLKKYGKKAPVEGAVNPPKFPGVVFEEGVVKAKSANGSPAFEESETVTIESVFSRFNFVKNEIVNKPELLITEPKPDPLINTGEAKATDPLESLFSRFGVKKSTAPKVDAQAMGSKLPLISPEPAPVVAEKPAVFWSPEKFASATKLPERLLIEPVLGAQSVAPTVISTLKQYHSFRGGRPGGRFAGRGYMKYIADTREEPMGIEQYLKKTEQEEIDLKSKLALGSGIYGAMSKCFQKIYPKRDQNELEIIPVVKTLFNFKDKCNELSNGNEALYPTFMERFFESFHWMNEEWGVTSVNVEDGHHVYMCNTSGGTFETCTNKYNIQREFKCYPVIGASEKKLDLTACEYKVLEDVVSQAMTQNETISGYDAYVYQKPCNQVAGVYYKMVYDCYMKFTTSHCCPPCSEIKQLPEINVGKYVIELCLSLESRPGKQLVIKVKTNDAICGVYSYDAKDYNRVAYIWEVFSQMSKKPHLFALSCKYEYEEFGAFIHAAGIDEIITRISLGEVLIVERLNNPHVSTVCGVICMDAEHTDASVLNTICFGRHDIAFGNKSQSHLIKPKNVKNSIWNTFLSLYCRFHGQGVDLPYKKGTIAYKDCKRLSRRFWAKCIRWEFAKKCVIFVQGNLKKLPVQTRKGYRLNGIEVKVKENAGHENLSDCDNLCGMSTESILKKFHRTKDFLDKFPLEHVPTMDMHVLEYCPVDLITNLTSCEISKISLKAVKKLAETCELKGMTRNAVNDTIYSHKMVKPNETKVQWDLKMNSVLKNKDFEQSTLDKSKVSSYCFYTSHANVLFALNYSGFPINDLHPKASEFLELHKSRITMLRHLGRNPTVVKCCYEPGKGLFKYVEPKYNKDGSIQVPVVLPDKIPADILRDYTREQLAGFPEWRLRKMGVIKTPPVKVPKDATSGKKKGGK